MAQIVSSKSLPFFGILILLSLIQHSTAIFACPRPADIAPCTCNKDSEKAVCDGANITQSDINKLFTALQSANKMAPSMIAFELTKTAMTVLDLSPLFGWSLDSLVLRQNSKLSSIDSAAKADNFKTNGIKVENLVIRHSSSLGDKGVQNLFKFIQPNFIESLNIDHTIIEGTAQDGELIPGIWSMTKLDTFTMHSNKIKKISRGLFRSQRRLKSINLAVNQIVELGDNAFVMPDPDSDIANTTLFLYLNYNQLGHGRIQPTALPASKRPTYLVLNYNHFESLEKDSFERFLNANSNNRINFSGNTLTCDRRLQWLRDRKSTLEQRVGGANCENDPGKNVFTTNELK